MMKDLRPLNRIRIPVRDITVFAVLGTVMFLSRYMTQLLPPNVHILGLFISAVTLTYRIRALIPIYVYVLVDGLFAGFSPWWIPYLYIWLPLWLMFMLAGKLKLRKEILAPLYMVLCGLHGLSFGVLYAPAQALMFGLSVDAMITWIIAGLWFDFIHAIGNFAAGTLIIPLAALLSKLDKSGGAA
jgi:energy-coupling factor transport system substrate-specific component